MSRNIALAFGLLVALPACHRRDPGSGPPSADYLRALHAASSRAAAKPVCASGTWPTYGHDPGRSGATPACCRGPLKLLWRFTPAPDGRKPTVATHAIVTRDAVYVAADRSGSPALYALDLSGKQLWSYDSHADVCRARWPTHALGRVVLNDDGFYWLIPKTGKRVGPDWLDSWGQTLTDGTRLYAVNEMHLDGFGVFVGAFDGSGKAQWQRNKHDKKRGLLDVIGAIALDRGLLFQAAHFRGVTFSGLYAFDAGSGTRRWALNVYPDSALSAKDGRVFLVEMNWRRDLSLVARASSDGAVRWSVRVDETDGAAPVLAGGKVITFSPKSGVVARDAKTGRTLWKVVLPRPIKQRPEYATALAAALGSNTLIAAAGPELAVVSLEDGRVQWRGSIDSAAGDLHSPVIAGGRVYVVSRGSVLALGCQAP